MKERHTLIDGVTIAVPYPKEGWNCQNFGIYAQGDDKKAPTKADVEAENQK